MLPSAWFHCLSILPLTASTPSYADSPRDPSGCPHILEFPVFLVYNQQESKIVISQNFKEKSRSQTESKRSESESLSVVSNSLQPHGIYSPWNSLGHNTEVGSLSVLQGIFSTQGI